MVVMLVIDDGDEMIMVMLTMLLMMIMMMVVMLVIDDGDYDDFYTWVAVGPCVDANTSISPSSNFGTAMVALVSR